MPVIQDMMERTINLPEYPQRIISLVPSQTELLYDLGVGERVVGITKFCIKPQHWYNSKPRIGGTKNVNHEKVNELHPDLIIANKEENTKEDIEKLSEKYPVWVSDINNYKEALISIQSIANICGCSKKGEELVKEIEKRRKKYKRLHVQTKQQKVLYLIWRNPWMTVGTQTYIHSILTELGYKNVVGAGRYPVLTDEELKKLSPDVVFLSSEPYPFKEKHIAEIQNLLPESNIKLVDGELYSWYGSRLLHTFVSL